MSRIGNALSALPCFRDVLVGALRTSGVLKPQLGALTVASRAQDFDAVVVQVEVDGQPFRAMVDVEPLLYVGGIHEAMEKLALEVQTFADTTLEQTMDRAWDSARLAR